MPASVLEEWSFLHDDSHAAEWVRAVDWGSTALGRPSQWPHSLCTLVAMLLRSPQPMLLWWGTELVQIYNDTYASSLGKDMHPAAMGQCGADCWRETWSSMLPRIKEVMLHATPSWSEDQLVLLQRNGSLEEAYWTYSYSAVFNDDGNIGGTLIVCTDTTARVLAERRMHGVDRSNDEFLGVLAHELRNPMAALAAASNLLSRASQRPDIVLMARESLHQQLNRMARILDDLLDVSRITNGTLELHKERLVIGKVIESAIEAANPLLDAKKHRLDIEIPAQPIYLDADQARLTQIVSNLLANAIKYTPGEGEIRVRACIEDRQVIISVADNGKGIAQEFLSRIFERFSQANPAGHRSERGLGIGLPIALGLAHLHDGNIDAYSPGINQGSMFVVRLPLAVDDPQSR